MTTHHTDQKTERVTEPERPEDAPAQGRSWTFPWRWLLIAAVLGGLYLIAWATGSLRYFQRDELQALVTSAGAWGVALFAIAFSVGLLLQVPGTLFVAVAVLVYGQFQGGPIALLAALLALSTTFWTVRLLRGKQRRRTIKKNWIKKILARLERRPVSTVATLRLLTFLSPPVNYALALSSIRYRDYIVGSALGLLVPFTVVTVLSDHFLM